MYEYTDELDSNGGGHLEPCKECANLQDEINRAQAKLRDSGSQTIEIENAAQRELAMAEESQPRHNHRFHLVTVRGRVVAPV